MRPGTPGFVSDRLKSAREVRGLSAASLAELIGVSRNTISQYENNRQTPSPQRLSEIAEKLSIPAHYFVSPTYAEERGIVFYRSLSTATKLARTKAERKYEWIRDVTRFLRDYIKFPDQQLSALCFEGADPTALTDDEIEAATIEIRQAWGLGTAPIANLASTMESKGITLARFELNAAKLDAFSEWCDGQPFVVLNSDKASAVRSRFDAAHELAHLVLHRKVTRNLFNTKAIFALMESQANRFAGAFLLPEREFTRDIVSISLDGFRALKPKWRTSIGAMIKRAAQLGILPEDRERRLWMNYGRRGWRRHEPYDTEMQSESPQFLSRSIELLISKQILSPSQIPFRLALPPNDLARILGLAQTSFCDSPDVELKDSDRLDFLPFRRPRD